MARIKIFFILTLLLVLLNTVLAQTSTCDVNSGYDKKECYSNPDFLAVSDATKWKLEFIRWSEPVTFQNKKLYERLDIYNKAEAYQNRDFYINLPENKYKLLNYKLANYDFINHNKVDNSKYLKDFGCIECSFDRRGQNVKFSEKGITHPNGDFVSIPGNYPTGTLFVANKEGIEVIIQEAVTLINIPKTDDITVNTLGSELTLPEGIKFGGKLSYKDGQAYVKGGDAAIIEGVVISDSSLQKKQFKQDINIFFDGDKQKRIKNYVSLNSKTKRLYANIEEYAEISLDFKKNNPFLKIEKGDRARILLNKNTEISVLNRDSFGKIPSVEVIETNIDSRFTIYSGTASLSSEVITPYGVEKLFTSVHPGESTSSPMSITVLDKNRKYLLGTSDEPKKIVISNYDEIATIPLLAAEGFTQTSEFYDYAPSKVSERLYYNYQNVDIENFRKEFPNIKLGGSLIEQGQLTSTQIKQLINILENMPPTLRGSIKGINLYSNNDYKRKFAITHWIMSPIESVKDKSETGASGANQRNQIINIPLSGLSSGTVVHEAAHALDWQLLSDAGKFSSKELYNLMKEYDKNNDGKADSEFSEIYKNEKKRIYEKYFTTYTPGFKFENILARANTRSSLQFQWEETAGNYGKIAGIIPVTFLINSIPNQYGCTTEYACSFLWEHIAESTGTAVTNPKLFRSLIDPNSNIYKNQMGQRIYKFSGEVMTPKTAESWANTYKKQLDLLLSYKFITEEQYNRVIGNQK